MSLGVYSDKDLDKAVADGMIRFQRKTLERTVQPSSIDLTFGRRVWCMPCSSIPEESIERYLNERKNYISHLDGNDVFLHKNEVYVIELNESLSLPSYVAARANPKSSTGRSDIHVRLLTDGGQYFDQVAPGYSGPLYLEVFSKSFDLVINRESIKKASDGSAKVKDMSFNQLRLYDLGTETLNDGQIRSLSGRRPLLTDKDGKEISPQKFSEQGAVYLTLDLEMQGADVVGYASRKDSPVLNLHDTRLNDPSDFFEPVKLVKGGLIINPDFFYILGSREVVDIPEDHCAEMVDFSARSGEFRSHYAGFFDPGFNAMSVLEVRNSGAPFLLKHGQRITSLLFSGLKTPSEVKYGAEKGSSYQKQGLKLSAFLGK